MRILRVITRLDVQGGAELSTLVEVEELAARGHDVLVLTVAEPATHPAAERLGRAGVDHRHLDGPVLRQALGLRRLVGSWSPDVVHAVIFRAEVVAVLAAARSGPPLIVSLVNMQYDEAAMARAPSPRRLDAVRRAESLLLRRADRFHCLTEAGRRHSVERLGVPADRVTVIPRGRRAADLRADDAAVGAVRSELAAPGTALVVNVGRHELQKGQDLLVEAVARLRARGEAVALAVAGREGNETTALRRAAAGAGEGAVHLLGARRDVPALLGAADVVAVTSRWEGLGGAVIEALGAGAAIVAFRVPAVAEVLDDAAVLVEPFDVDALAGAIRTLLDDPRRRAELAERARRRFAERFELDAVVASWEHLYRELAEAGHRRPRARAGEGRP